MRLHFKLSPNTVTVPYNYQQSLIGAFHKWVGPNKIHDDISLYSMSWLKGGKAVEGGLNFTNGAHWFISCWEEDLAKRILKGIMHEQDLFYDMRILEVQIQENPTFSGSERFITASPILVKKHMPDARPARHLSFADPEADILISDTLTRKLQKACLNSRAKVFFDRNYNNAKTKMVNINGIANKANVCPIIIEGEPEAISFAWNVGIGHSTGSGFGALI